MNSLIIKKLSLNINTDANGLSILVYTDSFKTFIKEIYFHSDYIDPIEEIINKISQVNKKPLSIPYGVYQGKEKIGFFTIEFSNPPVAFKKNDKASCWLDSFIIAKHSQGNGYAKTILNMLPSLLKKEYPFLDYLNLTVNFKNIIAKSLYYKCGFIDAGEVYTKGSMGPQNVLTKRL